MHLTPERQRALEREEKRSVCVFYFEGGIDLDERVKGGQVKLSDLFPVTWLDGKVQVVPGHTHTHTQTKVGFCLHVQLLSSGLRLLDSLELLGGFGPQRKEGLRGERRLHLRGQRVDGETLLLTNATGN